MRYRYVSCFVTAVAYWTFYASHAKSATGWLKVTFQQRESNIFSFLTCPSAIFGLILCKMAASRSRYKTGSLTLFLLTLRGLCWPECCSKRACSGPNWSAHRAFMTALMFSWGRRDRTMATPFIRPVAACGLIPKLSIPLRIWTRPCNKRCKM